MTSTKIIRVLLVEDHESVRQGLRMVLEAQADMQVVAEASNGSLAVQNSERYQPDVVVLDLSMPEMNGLAAAQLIKQKRPETAIVAFTRHDDMAFVDELMKAGASAYVLKQSASTELLDAVRAASVGKVYIDTALVARSAREKAAEAEQRQRPAAVSDREKHVLRMMAIGHSNKEIATALDISVRTVEVHKANAMRKLKLRGRIDVVRFAILHDWLKEP